MEDRKASFGQIIDREFFSHKNTNIDLIAPLKNIEKTNRNEADSTSPYYGRLNHDSSGLQDYQDEELPEENRHDII